MKARSFLLSAAFVLLAAGTAAAQTIQVYKDAGCGCCEGWIGHMERHGFQMDATDVEPDRMEQIKEKAGVDPALASCHTAFAGGYFIEGHVPAEDVSRLLSERPEAAGLTAPGMPAGSPGMEGAGVEPYEVLLVRNDGRSEVFARH